MPEGCEITPIAGAEARALTDWALMGSERGEHEDLDWLLAYFWDGVCWGRREGSRWRLGHTAFPDVVPKPRVHTLSELRLFGRSREALIWREADGLAGRWLADSPPPIVWPAPVAAAYITHGDQLPKGIASREGFTWVTDSAGMQQVLPLDLSNEDLKQNRPRIEFTQYFAVDPESGLVGPAAARLTRLAWSPEAR